MLLSPVGHDGSLAALAQHEERGKRGESTHRREADEGRLLLLLLLPLLLLL